MPTDIIFHTSSASRPPRYIDLIRAETAARMALGYMDETETGQIGAPVPDIA
jgi:hypothetical protein